MTKLFPALMGISAVVASTLTMGTATVSATPTSTDIKPIELRASKKSAVSVLKGLKANNSNVSGYKRTLFKHWVVSNGCDTRARVLIQESKKKVKKKGKCSVVSGSWKSLYDNKKFTKASGLDIDHLVPLAEAWRSGANRWNTATRTAYANDMGYKESLIAVSAKSNRTKSDKDPAKWLPRASYQCTYAKNWIAVKYRWGMTVDNQERTKLNSIIKSRCKNKIITLPKKASVKTTATNTSASKPSTTKPPSTVYYKNCSEAKAAGVTPLYRGQPGYGKHLDRDGDGVACEK